MKKEIKILPGYDKRKEGYGIHGCNLQFILKGKKAAVVFSVFTNWMTPEVQEETDKRPPSPSHPYLFHKPLPADIGFHALKPFEDYLKEYKQEKCCYLDDRPCYYDGSALQAQDVFNILTTKGSDGVWKYMEKCYKETFDKSPKK